LRLPGAPRAAWRLLLPHRRHLELDDRGLPTGKAADEPAEADPVGDRTYDDLYALDADPPGRRAPPGRRPPPRRPLPPRPRPRRPPPRPGGGRPPPAGRLRPRLRPRPGVRAPRGRIRLPGADDRPPPPPRRPHHPPTPPGA